MTNILNSFKVVSTSSIILGISFVLRFVLTLALARFLTADQLGIYSWAVTVFGILGIIVNFGLDFFLIRKIPEYRNSIVAMVGPVIKHVQKRSAINSIAIIVLLIPISYFSTNFFEGASLYNIELIIIIFALPFAAFSLIFSTALRTYDFPIRAQLIESILQTGVLLLLIFLMFGFMGYLIPEPSKTQYLVAIFVFSWIVSLIFSYLSYKKEITINEHNEPKKNEITQWNRDQGAIVFGILGWSFLGRSDIFLLAFLVSPADVGAYFICLRLAETLMFFSTVSYYVWGGEISNLIQSNNIDKAQEIIKKSTQLCIATTIFMTCFAWYFAEQILYLVNERYIEYINIFYGALCVFFIKGALGILNPMYYILGDQEFLAKIQWGLGIFFASLVLIFVPIYGIAGCIAAFFLCEILYAITLLIRLKSKHKLSLLPISIPNTKNNKSNIEWIEWIGLWGSGKTSTIHKLLIANKDKYFHNADFFRPILSIRNIKIFTSPLNLYFTIRLLFILLPSFIRSIVRKDKISIAEYRSFCDCYLARLDCVMSNSNRKVLWEGEIHMLPSLNISKNSMIRVLNILIRITLSKNLNMNKIIVMKSKPEEAFQRIYDDIPHLGHPRFTLKDKITIKHFERFDFLQKYLIEILKEYNFKVIEFDGDISSFDKILEYKQ